MRNFSWIDGHHVVWHNLNGLTKHPAQGWRPTHTHPPLTCVCIPTPTSKFSPNRKKKICIIKIMIISFTFTVKAVRHKQLVDSSLHLTVTSVSHCLSFPALRAQGKRLRSGAAKTRLELCIITPIKFKFIEIIGYLSKKR